MVVYFHTNVVSPPMMIFMGFDKHENEELIKWGWPEDVWFHVDKVSSAHVYLRLQQGQMLDDVPTSVIEDCAQLVKANSIQGNKMNNIDVVYTMWANLKKTASMDVGQVTFHNQKEVRTIRVEKRQNEIINRLNKTRKERTEVDLRGEKEERDRKEREDKKKVLKEQKEREKEDLRLKEEMQQLKSYTSLMKSEKMTSNLEAANDSDEFM